MKEKSKFFIRIFVFSLWVLLSVSLFNEGSKDETWRIPIFISFLLISIILFFKAKQLSPTSHLLISLMILANLLGEIYVGFYYTLPIHDKLLHFFVPFFLMFVSYEFLTPWIKDKKDRLKISITLVLALIFIWELFEIAFDYFFDAPMIGVFVREPVTEGVYKTIEYMNPLMDTFYDVILGIIGILIAVYFLKKKN